MVKPRQKEDLLYLLRLILRPVMRFCIRHSLKLQEIIEVCKAALIDVAHDEIRRTKKEESISRLSVMTGVHRPDVTRLVRDTGALRAPEGIVSRIIGQWQGDKRFCSESGKPRTLSVEGLESEFARLVLSVTGDLSPYAILFELERGGLVERTAQGVRLKAREYVRRDDLEEGFRFLSRDSDDLIQAVEQNLLTALKIPNLHLQTEYDKIVISKIPEIRKWLYDEGTAFHTRTRKFLEKFDRDVNRKLNPYEPTARVCVCSFGRVEDGETNGK